MRGEDDNMVDIEIGGGPYGEYLINFDKVHHFEDYLAFLLLFVLFFANVAACYFSPPSTLEITKNQTIIQDPQGKNSEFKFSLDTSTFNKFITIYLGFNHHLFDANCTYPLDFNISFKHTNAQSDRSKHSSKASKVNFTSIQNSTETNLVRVYYDRVVDYDQIGVNLQIFSKIEQYQSVTIKFIIGSESDFYIQMWVRVFYTALIIVISRYFGDKIKDRESRHEQLLTTVILFGTVFYNNPSIIIHYYKPHVAFPIFDDVLSAVYIGILFFFNMILIGHFGIREMFSDNFITTRLYIAGVAGIVMLMRNDFNTLAQIFDPTLPVNNADRYLKYIEWGLFIVINGYILIEFIQAWRRIEESDRFRFWIYILFFPLTVFVSGTAMNLLPIDNNKFFFAELGAANIFAFAMTYGHFPYSRKDSMEYNAPDEELENVNDNAIFDDEEEENKIEEKQAAKDETEKDEPKTA